MTGHLRHFAWLGDEATAALFHLAPQEFDRCATTATLAAALGATLYIPATRPDVGHVVTAQARRGVISMVVCLEDAIPDDALHSAEDNVVEQVTRLASLSRSGAAPLPLLFLRVRQSGQITHLLDRLGDAASVLSGFVLPKFTAVSGRALLEEVAHQRAATGLDLRCMPVLESPDLVHVETRVARLLQVRELLEEFYHQVLAVRIGATDMLSPYGLRRTRDLTVYDTPLLASAMADMVNVLGRPGDGFVVTGPVWEYFAARDRIFKPQLRQTPFDDHRASRLRHELLRRDLDGLIREAVLDRANGLTGKSVIHPSHVLPVHALSVVTFEEFQDATDIQAGQGSRGAQASAFGNKMNESRPHTAWAERTLHRARLFGVATPHVGLVDLLVAGDSLTGDVPATPDE